MSDYFILLETARLRPQEMFQQAETEGLYRQPKGIQTDLLKQIGHRLLAVAQQLEAYSQSNPAIPVFDQK